ncbi:NAD(P)H-dependent oxidoreductase [Aliivibrio sp. S2TY2]|uniref:NAD(P)H-dependent oxidoreductase n=1 Tax=unclassified Aliivibrio TaxID=2645654 RepID=UPI00237965F0|nr:MULTISPECIES: NAD(P)H-dependent oxidoreductase [unclassified Aliivibrio]MDD9175170.1 NAD(P)H-dependent oxidoreductase [Aliivibrio sp. S3TY1]MDD9192249.1 NAD(P)H-dependent oxidoreductase [Aliivibrio sp. S2TY2]
MKRILVLLAHPLIESSTINHALVEALSKHEQVTTHNLYQTYPDFQIDAEKEKELLLCHDIIVFVFPIYWYSSPSLLKEWQDCVLEYGFAYGSKGNKLHGKTLLCMTSTGSPLSAYQADDSQESIMKALLMPIEKMAQDTGLNYLEPITLYGSRTAVEEDRLAPHVTYCMDKINALLSEE